MSGTRIQAYRALIGVPKLFDRGTTVYDNMGNVTVVIDPLGRRTSFSYDGMGRLATEKDARGGVTTYVYDLNGNQTERQDAEGNVWTSVYDNMNRLSATVDPLSQRTSYGYDDAGRQQWRLDAAGQRTTYVYDDAGRQLRLEYSDGKRVTYSYDNAGNRTTMADATGTTTYSYDELNRPKAVTSPGPKTVSYTYDAAGNRSVMIDPDGGRTTYTYDDRNLLSALTNPQGEDTVFTYDDVGRQTMMAHDNLCHVVYAYDDAGRVVAVRNQRKEPGPGAPIPFQIFTYSYDDAGNRTAVAEMSGERVTWSYDESYQLTREQRSGANAYDITYSYDAVGNRLTKLEGGTRTTYSYDAANQLNTEVTPSQRTTYSYDANGNTQVINAAGSLTTYAWDIENHLTAAQLPAGSRTTATYDGDGKRRSYNDSGGLKNIVWDAQNIVAETDSGGSIVARYTMNPQAYGELASQRRSGATAFYHYDALGSTRALTNSAQTTTDTADYKAFGLANASSGSTVNPFTWVGRLGYYRQPDSADYWVRARVYRPQIGRWVSRDPAGAQARALAGPRGCPSWSYLYAHNRSVLLVDPSGLQPFAAPRSRTPEECQAAHEACRWDAIVHTMPCVIGCAVGAVVVAWQLHRVCRWLGKLGPWPFMICTAALIVGAGAGFVWCAMRLCLPGFRARMYRCGEDFERCSWCPRRPTE